MTGQQQGGGSGQSQQGGQGSQGGQHQAEINRLNPQQRQKFDELKRQNPNKSDQELLEEARRS